MKNKAYFPMFMDISEKKIVVIGAGTVALRRVKTLLDFSNRIVVIAPKVKVEFEQLAKEGKVTVYQREYEREDIYDAWMVLAATDQEKVNDEIYSVAKCLGILVNVASNQNKCDFHFPAIVKQDHFVVGVHGSGVDHKGVVRLRKQIQESMEKEERDFS